VARDDRSDGERRRGDPRRRFLVRGLQWSGAGAAWWAGRTVLGASLPWLAACGGASGQAMNPVLLRPEELAPGERLVVEVDGEPVEVQRTPEGVVARSLVCTHQGCRVRWQPDSEHYVCPCHDGMFDAAGQPVQGPPRRPLVRVPVRREGNTLVIGSRP
jgi:nitrite reductase/ring-hydroxylating ferredoxin subunit